MADKRLQAFHSVARFLSFTRAAESLQMTQPAVTFQIKQLEDQLNVRLFDRSHNRISLTEAGRRALDYAERIFGLYGEMESAIREVTGEVSGVLRIAAGNTTAQYMLTPLLSAFAQQFPIVQIRLDICSCAQAISMVENSFADIGVVETSLASKKLLTQPHSEIPWRFVVAANHPLANCQSITPEMIEQQTWVMGHETADMREVVAQYIQNLGIDFTKLRVTIEAGSIAMVKHAVEAGQGVAILPQAAITKELKLGTLAAPPLYKELTQPISFIYKPQKFPLKVVDEWLTIIKKTMAKKTSAVSEQALV